MQGHWINSAPYYRCRFPNEYALANKISHPRNVQLREDAFDAQVTGWLATALAPDRLGGTIDQMTAEQLPPDGTLPVWLKNDGLHSVETRLMFEEIAEMLEDLAIWADAAQNPATMREKIEANYGINPDSQEE